MFNRVPFHFTHPPIKPIDPIKMKIENYTLDEIVKELARRGYSYSVSLKSPEEDEDENDDDSSCFDISDYDDDELIYELESRNYDIYDRHGKCVSDPKKDPYYKEDHLSSEYILQRDFDRHQLRAHLVNITGEGSYASDSELLEELKNLLIVA